MKKSCLYCKGEFEQLSNKGSEQLYCSRLCRSRSASERFKNKLINNGKEIIEKGNGDFNGGGTEQRGRDMVGGIYENVGTFQMEQRNGVKEFNGSVIDCLKEKYASDVSTIFYKLKCEQLEKENTQLRQDVIELEMEIDELSMEEEQSPDNNILSGIMSEFKKDPQSTVSFATELITNFIKPKKVKENV